MKKMPTPTWSKGIVNYVQLFSHMLRVLDFSDS